MIPRREEDVLNINKTITNHADNTELEIWLSWMHYPIYSAMVEIANISKELETLELEKIILKRKIYKSLKREDYSSIKAMNMVIEGRGEVISLKTEIYKKKCDLTVANIKLNKYKNRNRTINSMAINRANTSNYQENIDWTVRSQRR